jgi:hypothetical protein
MDLPLLSGGGFVTFCLESPVIGTNAAEITNCL